MSRRVAGSSGRPAPPRRVTSSARPVGWSCDAPLADAVPGVATGGLNQPVGGAVANRALQATQHTDRLFRTS